MRVCIVGARTAGLTAALCLRHAGIRDVCIIADVTDGNHDDNVDLPPNASRILRALGVGEQLQGVAVEPRATHLRTWRAGYLLAHLPLSALSHDRYHAPYWCMSERHLNRVLRDRVRHLGIEVIESAGPATIDERAEGVNIGLLEGTSVSANVVIMTRGAETQGDQTSDVGSSDAGSHDNAAGPPPYRIWQGRVSHEIAQATQMADAITTWVGPSRMFINAPIDSTGQHGFLAVALADPATQGSAKLADSFTDWHKAVQMFIDASLTAAPSVDPHTPRQATPTLSTQAGFNARRLVAISPATSSTLPFLPMQTALGIEDAWVLSRFLERWEDEADPTPAFAEYRKFRQPRAERVYRAGLDEGKSLMLESGAALRRNIRLAIASRLLPEMTMSRRDWLYGYDAIHGFA